MAKLKQELEEAKERKKVGITEKEDLKKGIVCYVSNVVIAMFLIRNNV